MGGEGEERRGGEKEGGGEGGKKYEGWSREYMSRGEQIGENIKERMRERSITEEATAKIRKLG